VTAVAVSASYIPVTTSGSYPARPGNLVRMLVDGEAIARRIGEAIQKAHHSVWLTVAFYSDDFRFPDGLGPLFDVLDRAVARGLDVRLLIWRPNPETRPSHRMFGGTAADRALLARRGSRFRIRWDRAATVFCQHQKSWVIDAGQPSETAFVGGLNLTSVAMERHDVYVEVTGPSATDVHHNFVQRWNEASEREATDGNWACDSTDTLALPGRPSGLRGSSTVQIQRMLDPSRYVEGRIERSILEQYERAIDAARRTIYIENQAVPIPQVANRLLGALERGVAVVLLVPPIPEHYVYEARLDPQEEALFNGIEALGRHENFMLAGIAERHAEGLRAAYVHAKMMLVDDAWTTVGSCNLHAFSLAGHSEMNASIWDADVTRALRGTLFARHLGVDTGHLDDRAALRLFQDIARGNRSRMERREADWQGLAFALSPETYARKSGVKADLT
jgi:phosphatidylserine/phosphatidylglycerophosphate/cardiolipin synthase-like enzyme